MKHLVVVIGNNLNIITQKRLDLVCSAQHSQKIDFHALFKTFFVPTF